MSEIKNSILIETSFGELMDKITILQIKSVKIVDERKLVNILRELESLSVTSEAALTRILDSSSSRVALDDLVARLKKVNVTLWQIEDDIRECERREDFGTRFVELARSVYIQNDVRAALKRQINELLGSRIVEEKSYAEYG